jgi:hypothetical protein
MFLLQTKTISIEEVLEKILTMATFGSTIFFVIATLWGKAESVARLWAGRRIIGDFAKLEAVVRVIVV